MPAHFRENAKYLLTVSLLLSVFTLVTFNVQSISASKMVLGATTNVFQNLQAEKLFWESFLENNPTYLPGWVELGIIEEELGNLDASFDAFSKAEKIDPNWELK